MLRVVSGKTSIDVPMKAVSSSDGLSTILFNLTRLFSSEQLVTEMQVQIHNQDDRFDVEFYQGGVRCTCSSGFEFRSLLQGELPLDPPTVIAVSNMTNTLFFPCLEALKVKHLTRRILIDFLVRFREQRILDPEFKLSIKSLFFSSSGQRVVALRLKDDEYVLTFDRLIVRVIMQSIEEFDDSIILSNYYLSNCGIMKRSEILRPILVLPLDDIPVDFDDALDVISSMARYQVLIP